jgi:hypothetical protein
MFPLGENVTWFLLFLNFGGFLKEIFLILSLHGDSMFDPTSGCWYHVAQRFLC